MISLLASRASRDPELKALMKEVAAGNANQAQLDTFQRHIDELHSESQRQIATSRYTNTSRTASHDLRQMGLRMASR